MDKNYDQPLPPGVCSLANSSPPIASGYPSVQYPPQPFQDFVNVQQHAQYPANNINHVVSSNMVSPHQPRSFYPHFRPSTEHAPYAQGLPHQLPVNFQNNNSAQPCTPTFRQEVPYAVVSTDLVHGTVEASVNSDGSQQGGSVQNSSQLVESILLEEHSKNLDSREQKQVKFWEISSRNQPGDLGCSGAFNEHQVEVSTEKSGANAIEQQSREQEETGKTSQQETYPFSPKTK